MMDINVLRTSLLITLLILLVVVVLRRFKNKVVRHDLPALRHAELLGLEVTYHPSSLHIEVKVPQQQEVRLTLLGADHSTLETWPTQDLGPGTHVLEHALQGHPDGVYYLEVSTGTQRTVRQFRLQQA